MSKSLRSDAEDAISIGAMFLDALDEEDAITAPARTKEGLLWMQLGNETMFSLVPSHLAWIAANKIVAVLLRAGEVDKETAVVLARALAREIGILAAQASVFGEPSDPEPTEVSGGADWADRVIRAWHRVQERLAENLDSME